MPKRFDEEMGRLRKDLLAMGALAEGMISKAISVLVDKNAALIKGILDDENGMNALHRRIDEEVVRLIAVFTPVARDLRFLLMVTRINADLERVGDIAENICDSFEKLLREEPLKPLIDLPRMAHLSREMLNKALGSFVEESAEKAIEVIKTDDEVDDLDEQIFRELLTYMLSDTKNINRALGLILSARAFERIADHAVNIAEDVVYIVRGEDLRHLKDAW